MLATLSRGCGYLPLRRSLISARGRAVLLLIGVLSWPTAPAAGQTPAAATSEALTIKADSVTRREDGSQISAQGHVEVSYRAYLLRADRLQWQEAQRQMTALGNVILLHPNGDTFFAEAVTLAQDFGAATAQALRVRLAGGGSFTATSYQRDQDLVSHFQQATYTACAESCPPPSGQPNPKSRPPWRLRAGSITHDPKDKRLRYRNVWLEAFGLPVFYLPRLSHPGPSVRRASGPLAPRFGHRESVGWFSRTPYFFNLGADKDLLLTPYLTSERGALIEARYRQAFARGDISVGTSGTFAERYQADGSSAGSQLRGHIDARGRFDLNRAWRLKLQAQRALDDSYLPLYDLLNQETLTSAVDLEGLRGRSYALARAAGYQRLSAGPATPDQPWLAPYVTLHHTGEPDRWGGRLDWRAQALNLSRVQGQNLQRLGLQTAYRKDLTLGPGLRLALRPLLRANFWNWSQGGNQDQESRLFPQLGLKISAPFVRNSARSSQSFTPSLQAVLAPLVNDQDNLPNEDSQQALLSPLNLFSNHRIPGRDRIEDGSRLVSGAQWTLDQPNGLSGRLFLGHSLRFHREAVVIPDSGFSSRVSDVVGRWEVQWPDVLALEHNFLWDTQGGNLRQSYLSARLGRESAQAWLDHIYSGDTALFQSEAGSHQLGLGLKFALSDRWSLGLSHLYDLENDRALSSRAELGFVNSCGQNPGCFGINLVVSDTHFDELEQEPGTSVLVKISLPGAGN